MNQITNPYIAGNPVTGTDMFFGRQDVFDYVRRTLTGKHRDQVIVLYGQRRTGKTSVMYQMHRHLSERYLCIFVDLQRLALESLDGFLWELANHIQRSLEKEYQIDLPLLNQEEFLVDARDQFAGSFLSQLWIATGERHVLLMMDEAARLQEQVLIGKLEPDFFEYLRHLMQHYEQLNFLFSIGTGLDWMEKQYALLFNVAINKKISFLEPDAARSLITEPVQEYYQVAPSAVKRILDITSGHPYFIQLICHSIFNRWQKEGQTTIGVGDVNATLEEAVERGDFVLTYVWEDSDAVEKVVMAGVASAIDDSNQPVSLDEIIQAWATEEVFIPKGEAVKAIESLIAREVIVGDDRYSFTVALQQMWVKKQRRLNWVKEEISDSIKIWQKRDVRRKNRLALVGLMVLLLVILSLTTVYYPSFLRLGFGTPTPISVSGNVPIRADGLPDLRTTQTAMAEPQQVDNDGDGLSDDEEAALGTLPQNRDSDADGLSDFEEIRRFGTDPLESDSDGDGKSDSLETAVDCLDPNSSDSDGDGVLDNNDSDPCATSTPTPTASNTPSPSSSPTQTSTPTASITAISSAITTVPNTPTIDPGTVVVKPYRTPVDAPSGAPTGDGEILFTTLNRIYSIDLNGQNEREHGEARPGENTCGAQAQTALGETFKLHYGPYCGIGTTGTGSCRSPGGQHEVITNAVSLSGTSVVVRPIGSEQANFVFQGEVDRSEGIRWAPNGDKFLFVAGDTVYAASLDGSYHEIIPTAYQPQFSPGGELILYIKPVGPGIVDIFVSNADGTQQRNITNAAFDHEHPLCPRWSRS